MSTPDSAAAVVPSTGLAKLVQEKCGVNVNMCFQCRKCAVGCPTAHLMDYPPAQLIHAIRLGMDELVLNSKTMWLCASCQTCNTRCPQDVDIAKVMDTAKIIAVARGIEPALPGVLAFYKSAITNFCLFGRMYEVGMIMLLKMRTFEFFKDMGLGWRMFWKGKLAVFPGFTGVLRTRRIISRVRQMEKQEETTKS